MSDRGTRVFKKSSPNGKLTVYLGKRDFVDHVDFVEPVDGVVLVDPEYLKQRKVFVTLTCAFRYGREDLDVLGLTFRKDLFVANVQAFPPVTEDKKPLTRLQERLMKKLGEHGYPFIFEIPPSLPCSVTLQPGPEDTGKTGEVFFGLKKGLDPKRHLFLRSIDAASPAAFLQLFCLPLILRLCPLVLLSLSSRLKDGANKEILGIIVSYKVKVKLVVSRGGDVVVELPFTLMHTKPDEEALHREAIENEEPIDTNLIEFDTNDDDIVFEDFARQRLKGLKDESEENDDGANSPQHNDR
ncbi:beta-arrestin-1-like [Leucoraja erinacea]|uniref:beta-arrestin-1-like n=1 Tax=Leucoraja erinaceus TaxID=7782 RepID=UPI0024574E67|nr:beta-arrestin-1-like [Leucoraja erinacea]